MSVLKDFPGLKIWKNYSRTFKDLKSPEKWVKLRTTAPGTLEEFNVNVRILKFPPEDC